MVLEKLFMKVILPIVMFGAALAINILIALFILPANTIGCVLAMVISYVIVSSFMEAVDIVNKAKQKKESINGYSK